MRSIMKTKKSLFLGIVISLIFLNVLGFKDSFAASYAYQSRSFAGIYTQYIVINMNDKSIKADALIANNNLVSTQSVVDMAKNNKAFAAINGTYFDAYKNNKYPISYGTIIKNGKLLHSANGFPVVGIKENGKLIIDRLSFEYKGYINGNYRVIPWRINHPTLENESITIYTPEYGANVDVMKGAKAVVVKDGIVSKIQTQSFPVPKNGFAILYNPNVAYLVDERFSLGDKIEYEYIIKTQFTKAEDWKDVKTAIGAGPSLIINGKETADPVAEGFTESKITTQSGSRSFIGSTKEGKIIIGNFKSATIKQAAKACKEMGLINAMCLDGGGSVALTIDNKSIVSGRNVNNALGFKIVKENKK